MSNAEIFKRVTKRLTDLDDEFAEDFAAAFVAKVRDRTPVDTGRLKAGWETKVRPSEILIRNEVPYAGWVEDGNDYTEGAHMLKTTMSEIDLIADKIMRKQ